MAYYLSYWKPARVEWQQPRTHLLNHAASEQYGKILPGDHVYLITWNNKKFYLLGRMIVEVLVGQSDAAKRLDCDSDELWDSQYHILPAPGTASLVQPLECGEVLPKLFSISSGKLRSLNKSITPQHFQRMRTIAPASAAILDTLINPK